MKSVLSYALRELGPSSLLRFGQYRLGLNTGRIRRQTPRYVWSDRPLSTWLLAGFDPQPKAYSEYRFSSAPKLFVPESSVIQGQLQAVLGSHKETAISSAESITTGTFPLFGLHQVQLGFPPDWHAFAPLLDERVVGHAPQDKHWSEIELLELPSDVKLLWELNRFGWIFTLVRAFTLTGEKLYAEIAWELVQSWRDVNPPNSGLNWHSGQEVSIRLMALIFFLYTMQGAFAEHPNRVVILAEMIATHTARIPPTLSYAIAQGNNHLLVEAVGLYSVGALFPEFKQSARWRRIGRRWLIRALNDQVFTDGGYTQHSVNYHRLALQAALWAARISELQGEQLSESALIQLERMTDWLAALVDPETGAAPNFGPNDGAEILPMSMLSFDDHRPTLQAATRFLRNKPLYGKGLWDEWSLWLGVLGEGQGEVSPAGETITTALDESGLYILRGADTRGFLRASHFKNRPGHADQLHFDLWFGHSNIALDAGSYLYNAKPPWDNAFSDSAHHNTVLVDGADAMIRAGRFLWLNWNQAEVLGYWRSDKGELEVIIAERFGDPESALLHRRSVIRAGENRWLVSDDLLGDGIHTIDLSWLLPDLPWQMVDGRLKLTSPVGEVHLEVEAEAGTSRLVRAGACIHGNDPVESDETYGWFSPTYAYKVPALQLLTRVEKDLPQRILSKWLWAAAAPLDVQVGWNAPTGSELPLKWVKFGEEYLEIDDAHSVDPSSVRRAG